MTNDEPSYVLGDQSDEMKRLGLQHELWSERAHDHWERSGIGAGSRVLDGGAGPGFAAADLARLVGPAGAVTALEYSPVFVEALRSRFASREDGAAPVEVIEGDLHDLALAPDSHDHAWLRWVLCFLADPGAAIRRIGSALKSGGTLAILDYSNFLGPITLFPESRAFCAVVEAFHQSWLDSGGDPCVGLRLTGLLEEAGFAVDEIRMVSFAIRPTDPMWNWPHSFFPAMADSLVAAGRLDPDVRDAFKADWQQRMQATDTLFCTPCMLEIVARKL